VRGGFHHRSIESYVVYAQRSIVADHGENVLQMGIPFDISHGLAFWGVGGYTVPVIGGLYDGPGGELRVTEMEPGFLLRGRFGNCRGGSPTIPQFDRAVLRG
jgi:hypothetical protein